MKTSIVSPFKDVTAVFPVADVEKSIEWYSKMLGFEQVYVNRHPMGQHPTNYAVLKQGAISIHLVKADERNTAISGSVEVMFTIDAGIDELFNNLKGDGADVFRTLRDQPWGRRDFTISDLDGNGVWISQPT
jgi:uncharacterized glyoxalase superfamily protein PhnB